MKNKNKTLEQLEQKIDIIYKADIALTNDLKSCNDKLDANAYVKGFIAGHANGEFRSQEKIDYLKKELADADKENALAKTKNAELVKELIKMKNTFNSIELFCKGAKDDYQQFIECDH